MSATGGAVEPLLEYFFDFPPLNLPPSFQAFGGYFEEGDLPTPTSLLSPRTQATLEAARDARAAEEEAEAQREQA